MYLFYPFVDDFDSPSLSCSFIFTFMYHRCSSSEKTKLFWFRHVKIPFYTHLHQSKQKGIITVKPALVTTSIKQ
jgi:hypothetical protein